MLGSAGESFHLEDGPDICRNLALRLGGHYRSLPVPLVFDSLKNTRAVRSEERVATTLELAARSDVALTGVGAVEETTSSPLLRRWMTPAVMRECRRKNVVAHVCGHHLDTEGNHVRTALCNRTLCLDPSARSPWSSAWQRAGTRSGPCEQPCVGATCPPSSPTRAPPGPSWRAYEAGRGGELE